MLRRKTKKRTRADILFYGFLNFAFLLCTVARRYGCFTYGWMYVVHSSYQPIPAHTNSTHTIFIPNFSNSAQFFGNMCVSVFGRCIRMEYFGMGRSWACTKYIGQYRLVYSGVHSIRSKRERERQTGREKKMMNVKRYSESPGTSTGYCFCSHIACMRRILKYTLRRSLFVCATIGCTTYDTRSIHLPQYLSVYGLYTLGETINLLGYFWLESTIFRGTLGKFYALGSISFASILFLFLFLFSTLLLLLFLVVNGWLFVVDGQWKWLYFCRSAFVVSNIILISCMKHRGFKTQNE